jgi:hypothetical protein
VALRAEEDARRTAIQVREIGGAGAVEIDAT